MTRLEKVDLDAACMHPRHLPPPEEVRQVRLRLLKWFRSEARSFWWRQARDPFTIAIVEILLKQTRASSAERCIERICVKYSSPQLLADVDYEELTEDLSPLGFHHQRATHLTALAHRLLDDTTALLGSTTKLRELPGIGPYAASAISVFAHGRRETVIDVNVVRVFSRVWNLTTERGELRKSKIMIEVGNMFAHTSFPREANWALLDLGATVCTARNPVCGRCPLSQLCDWAEFRQTSRPEPESGTALAFHP
jgi:A/G-specific adenine glycosylase